MTIKRKFRLAIIGAGIGGLTFAVSLRKFCYNIDVDIYESATEFTEVGAGIGLWPRVWEIMQSLGLENDLLALTSVDDKIYQSFQYRKSDQSEGIPFHEHNRVGFAAFHRAHFQEILCKHLSQSCRIHFSRGLSSYSEAPGGEITLVFSNGSTAKCDVLVGCDGIKSVVRKDMYSSLVREAELAKDTATATLYRSEAVPKWSGTVAYRGLVPRSALEQAHPGHLALTNSLLAFGKNKHLVTYPVSQGRLINIVAFVSEPESEGTMYTGPWVRQCPREEVVANFSTWEPEIITLLSCLDEMSAWAINTLPSLQTYVSNRVALVGDAAHAMTPHQGTGAGQAAEDGFLLATVLSHPSVTLETLPYALKIYDEIRRPFSQEIVRRSRDMGRYYELLGPGFERLTENASASGVVTFAELEELGKSADGLIQWVGNTSIMGDRAKALELLDTVLK